MAVAQFRQKSLALSSQHLPFLDGMRGAAILLVMFHHFTLISPQSAPERYVYNLSLFGAHGVDLFFVLSGFLITGILLDTRESPKYFRNFYARRTLRIFPLYYTVLAVSFLLIPLFFRQFSLGIVKLRRFSTVAHAWPWYVLYCSNYVVAHYKSFRHGILDVSWSLSIEEQYYLVWALAVFVLSRRHLRLFCVATLILLPFLRAILVRMGAQPIQIYVLTPTRLDGLLWGGLLALGVRDNGALNRLLRRFMSPLGYISAFIVLVPVAMGRWDPLGLQEATFGYTFIAALFAAILWTAYNHQRVLRFIFEQKWLRFFGVYSYSLYLFHLPVRAAIRDILLGDRQFRELSSSALPGQLLFYCVATLAVIPLSLISWRYLEQPFLRLKGRFTSANAYDASA